MEGIYDPLGVKSIFLKGQRNKNTIPTLQRLFRRSAPCEDELNKDLCYFTLQEFSLLIEHYFLNGNNNKKPLGTTTTRTYISHIKNYLNDCNNNVNAILSSENIEEITDGDVLGWLETLSRGPTLDYLISYNDLDSLGELIHDKHLVAITWLLFIGLKLDEILNIKEDEIHNWDVWYRKNIQLPPGMKDKVTDILREAEKEDHLKRNKKGGGTRTYSFKNIEYFIKPTNSNKGKASKPTIISQLDKIKEVLNKKGIRETAIRKSGMVYFTSLLLKEHHIETYDESKNIVYIPISERFNIRDAVARENILHNTHALKEFYDISWPDKLLRTSLGSEYIDDQNIPRKRKPSDPKPYVENAKLGEDGEHAILIWIKNKYDKNAFLCYDGVGYDIYAKINNQVCRIEVKTLSNRDSAIHITKNEYEKAHEFELEHWFYLLILDNVNPNEAVLYTYKDLLGLLGLKNKQEQIFMPTPELRTEYDVRYNPTYDSFKICIKESILHEGGPPFVLPDLGNLLNIYKDLEKNEDIS